MKDVFTFDDAGFLSGMNSAQMNEEIDETWIFPPNSTDIPPEVDPAYWNQFVEGQWVKVKKPTTLEECIGLTVKHDSMTPHDHELRAIIETLAKGSKTHTFALDNETNTWVLKEIPQEDAELKALQAQLRAFDDQVDALLRRLGLAQLQNNTDLVAELQAEYDQLTGK